MATGAAVVGAYAHASARELRRARSEPRLHAPREEAAASRPVAFNFMNADLERDGRLSPLEFNNLALG
jgi:hypothetical protein